MCTCEIDSATLVGVHVWVDGMETDQWCCVASIRVMVTRSPAPLPLIGVGAADEMLRREKRENAARDLTSMLEYV